MRLGARWAVPALALVPPFYAFNIAATPDPPVVDLGPVIGMYSTALSAWLVWLGTRRIERDSVREKFAAEPWVAAQLSAEKRLRAEGNQE